MLCRNLIITVLLTFAYGCSDSDSESIDLTGTCPLGAPYCGGDFPLNNQDTTPYGPPWVNVESQFWPCYGPYALCYYADCEPSEDGTVTECPCESLFGLNFVEESSIMNLPVYEETVAVCNDDPDRCALPNGAPVCDAINNETFYETVPGVAGVSDFSFVGFDASAAAGTDCSATPGVYSGCMTSACYTNDEGEFTCRCPTFDGPFQVGQEGVPCNIEPITYSAAYNPDAGGGLPTPPPGIECFPDAGANAGNPIACPLYSSATVLPPDSGVDCSTVCEQYNQCTNPSGVEVGYTCDASICTTEDKDIYIPACNGLQNCDLSEVMKAEFAAGCSCCASQLCGCDANEATNNEIWRLNEAQLLNGDPTQCLENGTLCGTPPIP
jgi:hypothetical protein